MTPSNATTMSSTPRCRGLRRACPLDATQFSLGLGFDDDLEPLSLTEPSPPQSLSEIHASVWGSGEKKKTDVDPGVLDDDIEPLPLTEPLPEGADCWQAMLDDAETQMEQQQQQQQQQERNAPEPDRATLARPDRGTVHRSLPPTFSAEVWEPSARQGGQGGQQGSDASRVAALPPKKRRDWAPKQRPPLRATTNLRSKRVSAAAVHWAAASARTKPAQSYTENRQRLVRAAQASRRARRVRMRRGVLKGAPGHEPAARATKRSVRFAESAKTHDGLRPAHMVFDLVVWLFFAGKIRTECDIYDKIPASQLHLLVDVFNLVGDLMARAKRNRGKATNLLPQGGGRGAMVKYPAHMDSLTCLLELLRKSHNRLHNAAGALGDSGLSREADRTAFVMHFARNPEALAQYKASGGSAMLPTHLMPRACTVAA